jgi:hypothetical protein
MTSGRPGHFRWLAAGLLPLLWARYVQPHERETACKIAYVLRLVTADPGSVTREMRLFVTEPSTRPLLNGSKQHDRSSGA